MLGLEGVIVGAVGALGTVHLLHRLFFIPPRESTAGVPGQPSRVPGLGTRVHGLAPWSPPHTETGTQNHGEAARSPRRVQGSTPGNAVFSAPRTVGMGAGDQVRSFVEWLLIGAEGGPIRLTDKRVVANYQRWAEEWNVLPIPPSTLLAGLKKHPQVKHKRERLLDRNGFAVKNEHGSPVRPTFYTFSAAKPAAKVPGKVPVQSLDMVAHQPLAARPAVAPVPAQPDQHQPLRRAA